MKPERDAEFCDMDVVIKDPKDVLEDIGLLVLEARTPDPSVKGRKEGFHCSNTLGGASHSCHLETKECSLAASVKRHMHCAWQNLVPTYIEVLLLPNCKHGQKETSTTEGTQTIMAEEHLLLERWYIDIYNKRYEKICGYEKMAGCVSSNMLIQALRSYLHFSQLSSWLLSSEGSLPLSVVYRLSAPGEGVTHNFNSTPECHNFPKIDFPDHGLNVSVEYLPRQTEIPGLYCRQVKYDQSNKPKISQNKSTSRNKDALIDKESPTRKDQVIKNQDFSPKIYEHSKNTPVKDCNDCDKSPPKSKSPTPGVSWRRSPSPSTGGARALTPPSGPLTTTHCPKNEHNRIKSPSRQMFKKNLLPLSQNYESQNLEVADTTSKRLHSPKILLAKSSDTKVEYTIKKKRLDLDSIDDGLSWEKDYLSGKLNPEDINEYLSNLQNCSFSHSSPSDNNSSEDNTPRCKFYIGELCDHNASIIDNREEVETTLKRQRERNKSFEEVPRKLFAPCLSESCEIQQGIRTDLSEVDNTLPSTNGFNKSVDTVDSVTNGCQNGVATNKSSGRTEENGIQNVTDMLDKFTVKDCDLPDDDNNVFIDSGFHVEEENCDKVSVSSPAKDLHDSCFEKSLSLSDSRFLAQKCHTSFQNKNGCQNSNKRAFSVPDYSTDIEVATANGYSLCKKESEAPNSQTKVLKSPTMEDIMSFRRHLTKSASMMFNQRTGLPSQSSPAPTKRKSGKFDYDNSLTSTKAIKYALSCSKLTLASEGEQILEENDGRVLSTSAPASTNCLLGNFEESILNGRIEPIGAVDGFTAEIGASGSFCPKHIILPVSAYFFNLSDDNAPSPYLGHINLETLGKRGYHIPKKGTLQVTLFNPNRTVVKMFVVMYDMSDMPPKSQTFIRQRTLYMPVMSDSDQPSYLRYLIHLRFASTKSSKVYLHTDLRLLFARDKFEFDSKVAQYELRSFTEGPTKPKYSPKR